MHTLAQHPPTDGPATPGPTATDASGTTPAPADSAVMSAMPHEARAGAGAPARIGDYTVGARQSRRPLADLYEATHTPTGTPRLLYLLRADVMEDRPLVHRMVHEADAARWLRHDSAARVEAHGETADRRRWVVVTRPTGRTLGDLLSRGRVTGRGVVRLANPLVEALSEAHAVGLVHGRLTPAAIAVTNAADAATGPRVMLSGLGVTGIAFDPEIAPTERAYVSPEQLAGGDPTVRSDVFGLASVLHHALVGTPPAEGGTAAPTLPPGAPPELATALAVLATARAPEPGRRHASVKAFWEDLLSALVSGAPSETVTATSRISTSEFAAALGEMESATPVAATPIVPATPAVAGAPVAAAPVAAAPGAAASVSAPAPSAPRGVVPTAVVPVSMPLRTPEPIRTAAPATAADPAPTASLAPGTVAAAAPKRNPMVLAALAGIPIAAIIAFLALRGGSETKPEAAAAPAAAPVATTPAAPAAPAPAAPPVTSTRSAPTSAPAPVAARTAGTPRTASGSPTPAAAESRESSATIALPDVRLPSVDVQTARPLPTAGATPAELARRANGNVDDFAGSARVRGGNRP